MNKNEGEFWGRAYGEGYGGHETGDRITNNPYEPGSYNFREWSRGWVEAENNRLFAPDPEEDGVGQP